MKQGIVGFVLGLILGGLIMWFVLRANYEIVSTDNSPIAWVLNTRTGELYVALAEKPGTLGLPPYQKTQKSPFTPGAKPY